MSDHLIAEANRHASALTTERNQLRADRDYNHECINRLASATGTLGEKSEKIVDVALSTIEQLRAEVKELKARKRAAIASWDEERQRALRESGRVVELRAELAAAKLFLDKEIDCAEVVEAALAHQYARAEGAEAALKLLREWQREVIQNANAHHAERRQAIARAESAEVELANIRALANRRNKRDHAQDTTHQLVAALDQALDIAQAKLAADAAKTEAAR